MKTPQNVLKMCIDTLIPKFNQQLFRSVQYPHHCLHHLLPEKRTSNYSWQRKPRGHDYTLCHTHSTHRLAVWLSGNALASINVVALRQTRLVLGWVTVCGRVNHFGM